MSKQDKYNILFEATNTEIEIDYDGKTIKGKLYPIFRGDYFGTVDGFKIDGIVLNLDLITRIKTA